MRCLKLPNLPKKNAIGHMLFSLVDIIPHATKHGITIQHNRGYTIIIYNAINRAVGGDDDCGFNNGRSSCLLNNDSVVWTR